MVAVTTLVDAEGAELLLLAVATLRPRLKQPWAEGAYEAVAAWIAPHVGIAMDITTPPAGQRGFVVLATRWLIERSMAWLNRSRRLSKEHERDPIYSESMIYVASIRLLLDKLHPDSSQPAPYNSRQNEVISA